MSEYSYHSGKLAPKLRICKTHIRDFRFSPRCKSDLCSFVILHCVNSQKSANLKYIYLTGIYLRALTLCFQVISFQDMIYVIENICFYGRNKDISDAVAAG